MHLDFLNKNMLRKYPIRSSSNHVFTNGLELPQSLLAGLQISVPYGLHNLYISKIFANTNFLSIVISHYDSDEFVGSFSGIVTTDFSTLTLETIIPVVSGKLIVGSVDAIDLILGNNTLDKDVGRLEDSTILCYNPPGVSAITKTGTPKTGQLLLAADNIAIDETTDFLLTVIDKSLIASNNDFTGKLDNCGLPLIRKINTVLPDSSGNIDIYGIDPITIDISSGLVDLISGLTLDQVCPERVPLTPPTDNTDVYYTDILTATAPEWKGWPNLPT